MRGPRRMALAVSAVLLGVIGAGSSTAAATKAVARAHPPEKANAAQKTTAPQKAKAPQKEQKARVSQKVRIAKPSQAAEPPPEMVSQMAAWVRASGDNSDLPFVIIDKVAARVFVFDAEGRSRGAAPALLGSARGDESTPGIGDRELSAIPPADRTTPAGRFVSGFGSARGDQRVLWVDYSTAISLHPVVTANPKEHRLRRLQSPSAKDNRITYGCINVSAAFYQKVVRKMFTGTSGVVYILPERMPLLDVFPAFRIAEAASPAATGDTAKKLEVDQVLEPETPRADTTADADAPIAR